MYKPERRCSLWRITSHPCHFPWQISIPLSIPTLLWSLPWLPQLVRHCLSTAVFKWSQVLWHSSHWELGSVFPPLASGGLVAASSERVCGRSETCVLWSRVMKGDKNSTLFAGTPALGAWGCHAGGKPAVWRGHECIPRSVVIVIMPSQLGSQILWNPQAISFLSFLCPFQIPNPPNLWEMKKGCFKPLSPGLIYYTAK